MSARFEPGGQIGDYTLLRKLAAGGMGEIWLAERKGISGFSKRVVIKTILECFAEEPSLVDMFLDEGRIAAGLTHPNIAQSYDLGRVGQSYYIAMEYISGRDLRNILLANVARGQLPPLNLVLRIVAETCEGLYYAHTWKTPDGQPAHIIHRDMSPQNILVTFDGKVKIIDFGIAKAAQSASRTRSGVLKGKYAYMSPEQVRGKRIDARADLFSLGVVMYELVTARRLFKRESELSTLDAVLQSEVPPPTRLDGSVPPEVEAVLLKALAREPDARFTNAREMQLAIEEVMLTCKLPASSAHLASYMEELFEDDLAQEVEQEQESLSRVSRQMEQLPGVDERGLKLERTMPYAPGMLIDASTDSRKRELTRNLLASQPLHRAPRRAGIWKWGLVAFLVIVVGGASWFLFSTLLGPGQQTVDADSPVAPSGGSAAVADPAGTLDAGVKTPAGADADVAHAPPDAGPDENGLGLDLTEDPAPDPGPGRPVAVVRRGRLSVRTEPAADIYIGRRKVGHGSISGVKLKPGRYQVRAVASTGAAKTVKVRLGSGKSVSKTITFGTGKLRVVVMPWANVKLDGKRIGQTPMPPIELLEGTHTIHLANPSLGKTASERVRIRAGQETLLRKDFR